MAPDGEILCLKGKPEDSLFTRLLYRRLNQGTNDLRLKEGKKKRPRVTPLNDSVKTSSVFVPPSCEEYFPVRMLRLWLRLAPDSSILDRVTTIAMFGKLNKTYLYNEEQGKFNRGSFYFREKKWSVDEMFEIMKDIAERSVLYYFSKYTEAHFLEPD